MTGRRFRAWVAGGVGLLAALVCWFLVRRGPEQFLDAGSYAAGVEGFHHWRPGTSRLAPSFSHFTSVDFLRRGGRIPFSDFPLGFPLVAWPFALLFGDRGALLAVGVLAAGATVGLLVWSARPDRSAEGMARGAVMAVFGLGVALMPMYRKVLGAGLSEPLFILLVLLCVSLLLAAERDRPGLVAWAVAAAGAAGAVRFVGLALVVLPAAVLVRRAPRDRRTYLWIGGSMAPAVLNAAWGSAVGSGHQLALRRIDVFDVHLFTHSVAGWVDRHHGDFSSFFAKPEWPNWWGPLLALVWCGVALVALVGVLTGRHVLPRALELSFAAGGLLAGGLLGGMLLFDSLVTTDNRLMLPAGVVSLAGLVWWLLERWWKVAAGAVALWVLTAVGPWTVRVLDVAPRDPDLVAAVGDAPVVMSDAADGVWWYTGAASAYLPLATRQLTGEPVDQAAEIRQWPCLLYRVDGVVVLTGGLFADRSTQGMLDDLVASGDLELTEVGRMRRYVPTGAGCPVR